jgi:hypothetical protein
MSAIVGLFAVDPISPPPDAWPVLLGLLGGVILPSLIVFRVFRR